MRSRARAAPSASSTHSSTASTSASSNARSRASRAKPRRRRAQRSPPHPSRSPRQRPPLGPTLPAAAGVLLRTPGLDFDAFDAEVRAEFARVVAAHSTASSAPNASNDIGLWLVEIEDMLSDLPRVFASVRAGARARRGAREARPQQGELLQRRITKLARALEETEEELRHVANLKSIDRGVESAYRFVQGLSADEEGYDRKLGLLCADRRSQPGAAEEPAALEVGLIARAPLRPDPSRARLDSAPRRRGTARRVRRAYSCG